MATPAPKMRAIPRARAARSVRLPPRLHREAGRAVLAFGAEADMHVAPVRPEDMAALALENVFLREPVVARLVGFPQQGLRLHGRFSFVSGRGARLQPRGGPPFRCPADGKTRGAPAVGIGAKLPLELPLANRRHRPCPSVVRLLRAGGPEVFEGGSFRAVLDLENPLPPDHPGVSGFRRRHVFIPQAMEAAMAVTTVVLAQRMRRWGSTL